MASNTLCKLKVASLVEDPTKKVVLKIWKKQVLRSKKEYHRRKDGHGMVAFDQLMKVLDSEVKAITTLATSYNPNVVRLLEIIDDEAGFEDKLILVMEHCPGGQLLDWTPQAHAFTANRENENVDERGFVEESTIKKVVREVAIGLQYCHEKGVLHRDIKPQNIIFGEDHHTKIIDFGVSKVFDVNGGEGNDTVKTSEGTYHFMAPEACDPDIDEYSGKALDVWALGVTLYALLYNKCPFWGETDYQIMESIRNDPVNIPSDDVRSVSPELMNLLKSLLEKNVSQRATLSQVIDN